MQSYEKQINEFSARHQQALRDTEEAALRHVFESGMPSKINLNDESFSGLIGGVRVSAKKLLDWLIAEYGGLTSSLLGLAVAQCYFECHRAVHWNRKLAELGLDTTELWVPKVETADDYGRAIGFSEVTYRAVSNRESDSLRLIRGQTDVVEKIPLEILFSLLACYFYSRSSASQAEGDDVEAHFWLAEANNASLLEQGLHMWGRSEEFYSQDADINARSVLAKTGAHARHAETRAMKKEVFTWLDSNRINYKSMEATAQAITKEQPIAFRTARAWVGEWHKLRSAGTP
jgi:hypothetical protein